MRCAGDGGGDVCFYLNWYSVGFTLKYIDLVFVGSFDRTVWKGYCISSSTIHIHVYMDLIHFGLVQQTDSPYICAH